MYDCAYIKFATSAVCVLGIIAACAVAAFALKNRVVFVAGAFGSLLGYIVPVPGMRCMIGPAEAVFMSILELTAEHMLFWGMGGAVAAAVVVANYQALIRSGRIPKQYSLRTLFLLTTAIAAVAAIVRFLAS